MWGTGCRSGDDLSYSPFRMLRLRPWKVGQRNSGAHDNSEVQDGTNNVRAVWVELEGSAKKLNIFYISTYLHVTTNSEKVRPLSVIDIKSLADMCADHIIVCA